MMPNRRKNNATRCGVGLLEIMACVLIMAIAFLPLFNVQMSSDRSMVKAGEFMVAGAVLHNMAEMYKIKPFEEIADAVFSFDESGGEMTTGNAAFKIRVAVETVPMPNNWCAYKRIYLDVEKPGTFFGTTLLKTALLRVAWVQEP